MTSAIYRCVLFLLILSTVWGASTQIAHMQTQKVEQSNSDLDVVMIKASAEAKIKEYPSLVKPGYKLFQAETVRVVDSWGFLNLLSFPTEVEPNTAITLPIIVLAIAQPYSVYFAVQSLTQ